MRWLRLSSVLPSYFTDELLDDRRRRSPAIAPHFHVPLQSGSDRVLRLMRRPYTVAMYRRWSSDWPPRSPASAWAPTSSSGFPGETDEDFEATLALVEALPFSYLHVFPYSERRGHRGGAAAGSRVDRRTIARAERGGCASVGAARGLRFRRALVGRGRGRAGAGERATGAPAISTGLTGNYVEVTFRRARRSCGRRLARVRVTAAGDRTAASGDAGGRGVARMSEPAIGVIGGSGLYEMEGLEDVRWVRVRTPFGDPSDEYCTGTLGGRRVIFLPRHGRGHRLTPDAS